MQVTLRPEQQKAVQKAIAFLSTAVAGDRLPFSSPTGTGKTYVALDIRDKAIEELRLTGFIVSPSDDILSGFAAKLGIKPQRDGTYSKEQLQTAGLWTPICLRNRLADGTVKRPDYLIIDEAHHWDTDTSELVDLLCSGIPCIGLSATMFRGTPKQTADFRRKWGKPTPILTMKEATTAGYMTFPTCNIIPLVDDDVIAVKNGEFTIASMNEQMGNDVVERLVFEVSRFYSDGKYDKATMLSLPSVELANMYTKQLNREGLPAVCVTGETKRRDRGAAFKQCLDRTHLLVQIRVVSEGVDFPFRRLIDMSPTLSPVLWLQQFGRITRPSDEGAEYICTNRNLLRHAYLLEGLLPVEVFTSGEAAFGKPSDRQTLRALGFEGLGKFQPVDLPMRNGTTGQLICVHSSDGTNITEYVAIASPLHSDVLYAKRVNVRTDGDTKYDTWVEIPEIPDLERGFASIPKGSLSDKQRKWWKNAAKYYGFDPDAKINRRQFVALPVMKQTLFHFR